jgi:Family of unknown function (DUF6478)
MRCWSTAAGKKAMAERVGSFLEVVMLRKAQERWSRAAAQAPEMDLNALRIWRGRARALRREVDRVIHAAEARLSAPRIGTTSERKLPGTDWIWRPDVWRGPVAVPGIAVSSSKTPICDGVVLFHDCTAPELVVRQMRNRDPADFAAYGLIAEMFGFDGSFLSLAITLPQEAVSGLRLRHVIRLETAIAVERPVEIFARLNIKHGPNVEQILRELPRTGQQVAEFDLAYSKFDERRVENMWLDLIFERPAMNRISLRDVMISRRPRADI